MSGARFQIGDRVRTIRETWGHALVPVGAVGTVIEPSPLMSVAFDHDPDGDGTGGWAMHEGDLSHLGEDEAARTRLREGDGQAMLVLHALRRPSPASR